MLCGLLRSIDGRNILRSISHDEPSNVVMEPGLSLLADFSNCVSIIMSPTAWTSGFFGGVRVCGRWYFWWKKSLRLGIRFGDPSALYVITGAAGNCGSQTTSWSGE